MLCNVGTARERSCPSKKGSPDRYTSPEELVHCRNEEREKNASRHLPPLNTSHVGCVSNAKNKQATSPPGAWRHVRSLFGPVPWHATTTVSWHLPRVPSSNSAHPQAADYIVPVPKKVREKKLLVACRSLRTHAIFFPRESEEKRSAKLRFKVARAANNTPPFTASATST